MRRAPAVTCLPLLLLLSAGAATAAGPVSPDEFLGRKVGEDRFLAPWPKVVEYFRLLDAASPRLTVESAGVSTLGNDMPVAILTSEANQGKLDRYREIARRLANADSLSEAQAGDFVEEGKAIVLVTCSIHAPEVASTQMAMELAWELATTDDPEILRWLDDAILLLMPSINPDGQVLVVDWYNRWLGTEFEGGDLPWLYHPYAGHDNNRDYFMLTQKESRAVNDVLYRRWFPQVYLDEHQMGSTGPRMFVPPQTDPLAPEVDARVFRLADTIGTAMALRLEEAGKAGVGSNMIFDSYWPGGTRNTAWFKNVVGLLSEVASARYATPIYVEPGELSGGAKGFPEYGRRANYPSPWPGGWWRLRDIVEYEKIATLSLLETAATHRRDILRNFYRLNRDAVAAGQTQAPYAFAVAPDQHDPAAAARMIDLLLRHGVRVHRAEAPFTAGRSAYPAGTHVVLAAQPYRPFVLTMLQPQRYPEVLPHAGGPVLEPYDITSWSLPLLMGVEVERIESAFNARLYGVEEAPWPGGRVAAGAGGWRIPRASDTAPIAVNRLLAEGKKVYALPDPGAAGAPGDFWIPPGEAAAEALTAISEAARVAIVPLEKAPRGRAFRLRAPRAGLHKPWIANMDEGWTRWVLEQYGFAVVSLTNEEIRKGSFAGKVDALVLPHADRSILKEGKPPEERRRFFTPLPPEYAGGLDKEGGEAIRRWVAEGGGTLVALGAAADYAIEALELPVANVLEKVKADRFNCPGAMLRLAVDTSHPLGWGMRAQEAAFFDESPAFQTRPPDARFERRVVASFPADERDLLVSGWIRGGDLLERRAAVVDLGVKRGRAVLLGPRVQSRAQPHRTFKLLFNALYRAAMEEVTL